jgi:hypothetical protein
MTSQSYEVNLSDDEVELTVIPDDDKPPDPKMALFASEDEEEPTRVDDDDHDFEASQKTPSPKKKGKQTVAKGRGPTKVYF